MKPHSHIIVWLTSSWVALVIGGPLTEIERKVYFEVKVDNGTTLCAVGVVSKSITLDTGGSITDCTVHILDRYHKAFNHRPTQNLCEIFATKPTQYDVIDDCLHYEIHPMNDTSTIAPVLPSLPPGYNRTVVFIYIDPSNLLGQDVFFRGGVDRNHRSNCTPDAAVSPCAISIITNFLGNSSYYILYNALRINNTKLNWYGPQADQGTYQGKNAWGTPAVWTTNNPRNPFYNPLNKYGPDFWMMDVLMKYSETKDGWFDVKGFLGRYEHDVIQVPTCTGSAGGSTPYVDSNHLARCGFVNTYWFERNDCDIDNF